MATKPCGCVFVVPFCENHEEYQRRLKEEDDLLLHVDEDEIVPSSERR